MVSSRIRDTRSINRRWKSSKPPPGGFKVDLCPVGVREPKEPESPLSSLAGKRAEALVVYPDGMFQPRTSLIVALAARCHFPALYGTREYIEAVSTGSASLADKSLKGAKPTDLPVEQPTKFELVIDLKTAKSLRVTIPQSLQLRADRLAE